MHHTLRVFFSNTRIFTYLDIYFIFNFFLFFFKCSLRYTSNYK